MRFMMFVKIPTGVERWEPTAEEVGKMTAYNEELQKAGVMLAGEGLHPPSEGAVLEYTGDRGRPVDGPFAEAKEVVGGYWIIQAKSLDEAIEWASRAPFGAIGEESTRLEIRRIYDMGDFPEDVQEAAQLPETPPEQTFER